MKELKNSYGNYAKYSVVAVQMGATIYMGAYLGKYLDGYFEFEKKWMTMVCVLGAVGVSLYNVLRQVQKIQAQGEKKEKGD